MTFVIYAYSIAFVLIAAGLFSAHQFMRKYKDKLAADTNS